MIDMRLGDCMDLMREAPDGAWDLAIVDPEFGHFIEPSKKSFLHTTRMDGIRGTLGVNSGTDVEYFIELARVSKKQIVWGGNYFLEFLGSTKGMIIWDKIIDGNTTMNWAELAWQNVRQQTRIFRLHSSQADQEPERIHPNQKPVELYRWTLMNYAKPGWKILDTHGGSGSSCIAAHDLGYELTWIEKDPDYFEAATKRYQTHAAQLHLFDPKTREEPENLTLTLDT